MYVCMYVCRLITRNPYSLSSHEALPRPQIKTSIIPTKLTDLYVLNQTSISQDSYAYVWLDSWSK